VRTSDFDYHLPPELIAQEPATQRDQSRLLVLSRTDGSMEHRRFSDLPHYLRPGDVLVLNDSRVIPARLRGRNARSGGEFELLLLEENGRNDWWVMLRPGRRARVGTEIVLTNLDGTPAKARASVVEVNPEGHRRLRFEGVSDVVQRLDKLGEVPLPPYIERAAPNLRAEDRERYQTIYARVNGSVAAPTAGLHFTQPLLDQLREMGVAVRHVTLHVGLGTFAPVKADRLEGHAMHEERYEVSRETADLLNQAKAAGKRIVAVGTTVVRVLEAAAFTTGRLAAGSGRTRIFLHPPCQFRMADAMLTNFHLPCSTLLMLVCAFAGPGTTGGRDRILTAYAEAIRERYRFFSYGDAMLIL
jgi:S-adenosylmethionine:tRNA ribosyltransferase-isomerase